MNRSGPRNALAALVLALTGVLLIAVGFLVATIVLDDRDTEAMPATVLEATATPATGTLPTPATAAADGGTIHTRLIDEIIGVLKKYFVEPELVDREALIEAAINGVFRELGDPHLAYIDPDAFAVLRADIRGAFQGIGATIARQGNFVVIVQPLPGTPAEYAGIQPGDVVLEIDGESTEGWSVRDAVLRIRGRTGTIVELRIRRSDGTEDLLPITRDEILVDSVDTTPPGGVLKDRDDHEVADLAYIRSAPSPRGRLGNYGARSTRPVTSLA